MAWIVLQTIDVQNSLTEAEQSGLSSASAQQDLFVVVSSVTNLVRGKVNSNKRNQGHLGVPGTIPDELYAAAISIARFKYLTHLPGTQLITKERTADKDEAYAQLEAVAKGELVIVRGDDINNQTPIPPANSGSSSVNLQGPPWLVIAPTNGWWDNWGGWGGWSQW